IGQGTRYPMVIASVNATRLDDAASHTQRGDPETLARLGFAVANAINGDAPAPESGDALRGEAAAIAEQLLAAAKPLVVAGVSLLEPALLRAAANICTALV